MERFIECPHCGGLAFHAGPSGGSGLHLFCENCGSGYSVFILPDGYYLDQEIRPPTPREEAS